MATVTDDQGKVWEIVPFFNHEEQVWMSALILAEEQS